MTDDNSYTNVIVTLTKDEAKLVNWMRKSLSDDPKRHIAMQAIMVNGELVATDGYRMMTAPTPVGLQHLSGKIIQFFGVVKPNVPTAVAVLDCNYPDYKSIIPTVKPIAEFTANPKFMIDALSGYDATKAVTVELYPGLISISGEDEQDQHIGSIIMPMRRYSDQPLDTGVATYQVWPVKKDNPV